MPTDFDQFAAKVQEETLKAVKQAQDTNVAVLQRAREMFADASNANKIPSFENLPSPTKAVELAFDYANKVLELQKDYALRVAEIFTSVQKEAAQTTARTTPTSPSGAKAGANT